MKLKQTIYFYLPSLLGTSTRGTSIFDGDVHVSGAITSDITLFGVTLDQAYDFGGAGAGKEIIVDYVVQVN